MAFTTCTVHQYRIEMLHATRRGRLSLTRSRSTTAPAAAPSSSASLTLSSLEDLLELVERLFAAEETAANFPRRIALDLLGLAQTALRLVPVGRALDVIDEPVGRRAKQLPIGREAPRAQVFTFSSSSRDGDCALLAKAVTAPVRAVHFCSLRLELARECERPRTGRTLHGGRRVDRGWRRLHRRRRLGRI